MSKIQVLYLVGAFAVAFFLNGYLLVLKVGNYRRASFARKVANITGGLPNQTLLVCKDKEVGALLYDQKSNSEKVVSLYTGEFTWKGGPILASKIALKARRRARLRFSVFSLVSVPSCIAAIILTFVVHWIFILVLLGIVVHQFVPFYLWNFGFDLGESMNR